MSIGGVGVVLLAPAGERLGEIILTAFRRHWAQDPCFFQDAGDQGQIRPFEDPWVWKVETTSREFFVFPNEEAAKSWAEGPTRENINQMLHFLIGDGKPENRGDVEVCLVCDKLTPK